MNNKGFTLIELIAIVLVLALIMLVSFPALLNTGKADEQKKYDAMVKDLCKAGESYIYSNLDDFNELLIPNNTITINIEELMVYGNVNSDLKNPKTNMSVKSDEIVFTILNDNSLECEYNDK